MAHQSKTLLIATKSHGKAREFADLLGAEWKIETLLDHPQLREGIEDGATFAENAEKKARAVAAQVSPTLLVLADDSGLEVDALQGAPGVYSARYAGEPDKTLRDAKNNEKLLHALKQIPLPQRTAQFRCALCLIRADQLVATSEGSCQGHLLEAARGDGGFGYDSLFVPNGFDVTFGQIPLAEKQKLSHRAQAVRTMVTKLENML